MNRLELAEKLREIAYDVEQGAMGEGEVFERICEMLSADSGEIACTISSIAETQQSIAAIQQMTEMRVEDVEQALTKLEQRQSLRERFPPGSIVEVPKRDAMSYTPTPADLDTFLPVVLKGDDGQGGDVHYTINGKRVTQAEVDKLAESGCGYVMTTAVQCDRDGKVVGEQVEIRTGTVYFPRMDQ